MTQADRNIQVLRRCQLQYDNMEPPEYWDDEGDGFVKRDDDGELYIDWEKENAA